MLSHARLFVTAWIAVHQDPQSMEFFRQEYWTSLHFLILLKIRCLWKHKLQIFSLYHFYTAFHGPPTKWP